MPVENSILSWDEMVRLGTIAGVVASASWFLFTQLQKLKYAVFEWLQKHEDKDQARHEDNIQRFAIIETLIKQNGKH